MKKKVQQSRKKYSNQEEIKESWKVRHVNIRRRVKAKKYTKSSKTVGNGKPRLRLKIDTDPNLDMENTLKLFLDLYSLPARAVESAKQCFFYIYIVTILSIVHHTFCAPSLWKAFRRPCLLYKMSHHSQSESRER